MVVTFYANHHTWGGLSNNGGTRTVLKSCEVLDELGYKTEVVAGVDRFTYFVHKRPVTDIPKNTDVLVAVSVAEIPAVNKFDGPKAIWLRGWEKWTGIDIAEELKRFKGKVICNSSWLVSKLAKKGIEAVLCYAGYDGCWEDLGVTYEERRIGGLFSKRPTKNFKFFKEVMKKLNGYKFDYEIGKKPMNETRLQMHYNYCDIWLATSYLEGFHQHPMEAALCGCLVVASDHPRAGVNDYCNEDTAMIYRYGDVDDCVEKIMNADFNRINAMKKLIFEKIGDRRTNMEKFVELIK